MDEQLDDSIKRVQAGDAQQYAFIVGAFQRPIFVYCWRMLGSRQEAEDAVQDILVRAFEKIHMYKPRVSFSSWLYKIAYHHCLNLIRSRKRQQRLRLGLFRQNLTADSPAQAMERRLFSEPLSKALERLTAEERNLLVLRVFEEKPFGEIGEILNKSPDAVKKKFGRTKMKLQKSMSQLKEEEACMSCNGLFKTKI